MRVRYSFGSRHTGNLENIKKQRKKFPDVLKEVIKISDIILEVLDARFISETRNKDIEEEIKKNGKKIIYVLNKADLVDSRQKSVEVRKMDIDDFVFVSCRKRQGVSKLRNKIKEEVKKMKKSGEIKYDRAQVGIVGYPNTGKSSLINILAGRSSAGVGAQAGFTKGIQKIRLSSEILILDTPGVIPSEKYSHEKSALIGQQAKVGARTLDKIKDAEEVVFGLMKTNSKDISKFYKIDFEDFDEFIEELGKKKNFLKKGGLVDEDRTCKMIIRDWQEGKIRL